MLWDLAGERLEQTLIDGALLAQVLFLLSTFYFLLATFYRYSDTMPESRGRKSWETMDLRPKRTSRHAVHEIQRMKKHAVHETQTLKMSLS